MRPPEVQKEIEMMAKQSGDSPIQSTKKGKYISNLSFCSVLIITKT